MLLPKAITVKLPLRL